MTAAMAPMATHGSIHGVCMPQRREPSLLYGYGLFRVSRLTT